MYPLESVLLMPFTNDGRIAVSKARRGGKFETAFLVGKVKSWAKDGTDERRDYNPKDPIGEEKSFPIDFMRTKLMPFCVKFVKFVKSVHVFLLSLRQRFVPIPIDMISLRSKRSRMTTDR